MLFSFMFFVLAHGDEFFFLTFNVTVISNYSCKIYIDWVWGNESDVRGGKGPKELPPSRGWSCSVENNLFSKRREARSCIHL
jgi:hypothetical protein